MHSSFVSGIETQLFSTELIEFWLIVSLLNTCSFLTSTVSLLSFEVSSLFLTVARLSTRVRSGTPISFPSILKRLFSSHSDKLLSEQCRFLDVTLAIFFESDPLPEEVRCDGTTILSNCKDANSWLEPTPESCDKPFRHDWSDSSFTGGFSRLVFGFLYFLGLGGKKLFRTYWKIEYI